MLAGRLSAEGQPFALATVVNVVRPASTRRGDRAVVTPEGEVSGWIGGACSEPSVVREALRALADGEARVVRMEGELRLRRRRRGARGASAAAAAPRGCGGGPGGPHPR